MLSLVVCVGAIGVWTPGASAASGAPGPAWSLQALAVPTNLSSAQNAVCEYEQTYILCDRYTLIPTNVGSLPSSGTITVRDVLPLGVRTAFESHGPYEQGAEVPEWDCTTSEVAGHEVVTCTSNESVPALTPTAQLEIALIVEPLTAGSLTNEVEISGGGASSPVKAVVPTTVGGIADPFGLIEANASALDAEGALDTQAGSHPAVLTSSYAVPTVYTAHYALGVESLKQIAVDLPAGLLGDARAAATCPLSDVSNLEESVTQCPRGSRVGRLTLVAPEEALTSLTIFNVVPERGYPAEFAVFLPGLNRAELLYAHVVGSGANTHVQIVSAPNIHLPSVDEIAVSLTFFGEPAVQNSSASTPVALATNPSDCAAPGFDTTFHVDSWEHPGATYANGAPDFSDPNWKSAESLSPPVTGCEQLQFRPTISLQPETTSSDSPSGLLVHLHIPQNEDPNGLATPPLRDATVTLPAGLVVDPSSAGGLQGCAAAQIAVEANEPGACPLASQIGEVELSTPLLEHRLPGKVYVGSPECDPCSSTDAAEGKLIKLYIEVNDPVSGVIVKLPGTAKLDPKSGQITASFEENPQLPFEDLKLEFKSGPRAPLATPDSCGSYTTTSLLEPWSHQPAPGEAQGTPDATPTSSFTIDEGCGAPGFSPTFSSGTIGNQAGGYSPLLVDLTREDGEQGLDGLQETLPPGVLAKLAGVPRCGEAEASTGACPEGSQIGTVTVAAGAGPNPYPVQGKIYLTGPYNNGPFGEVVVVPAVAGPFNLGTVIVRGSIRVNPTTAQASVVSDPFPTILDGIPLQIRNVSVQLNRPGFTFNATNCSPLSVSATIASTQGTAAPVSSRYQAANCAGLPFKPAVSASAQGNASKANGASLVLKIASKSGEANIAKTDLQFPVQLPTRDSTLQLACVQSQFEANPGGCPAGSDIGTATIATPLLNVPLTGPIYLVSHGGAAFPDVEMVLEGENVEIVLDGKTDIKHGITYSRFEAVPDAPFTSFEANLPTGPHSIFTTNLSHESHNLCGQTLTIPTSVIGQNGVVINHSTPIAIENCSSAISIASHATSGKTLTLSVYVPAAGEVKVSGKGLRNAAKRAKGQEILTFKVAQKASGKLSTKVSVTFNATKGRKQARYVAVNFKR